MLRRLLLFFVVFSLLACGSEKSFEQQEPSRSIVTPPPAPDDMTVCYSGDLSGPSCLPVISLGDHKDYQYIDFDHPDFPPSLDPVQYRAPVMAIDLRTISPENPLAPNFHLAEFMQEQKGVYGIFSPAVVSAIQWIRDSLNQPVHITSGYRSPGYNANIPGAARWSRHMYGDALDFFVDTNFNKLAELCRQAGAGYWQLYQGHVHCDWRETELHESFFGPAPSPPTTITARSQYSQESTIEFSLERNELLVRAVHPPNEDEGKLLYEWLIEAPDRTLHTSAEKSFRLPAQSGTYRSRVRIGGFVEVHRTWQIGNPNQTPTGKTN